MLILTLEKELPIKQGGTKFARSKDDCQMQLLKKSVYHISDLTDLRKEQKKTFTPLRERKRKRKGRLILARKVTLYKFATSNI